MSKIQNRIPYYYANKKPWQIRLEGLALIIFSPLGLVLLGIGFFLMLINGLEMLFCAKRLIQEGKDAIKKLEKFKI